MCHNKKDTILVLATTNGIISCIYALQIKQNLTENIDILKSM